MSEYKVLFKNEIKEVTPELAAEMFAGMGSDEQARFFNHVAEISSKWSSQFCFQLQWITDEEGLTMAGRRVMQGIGEYSHWGLVQQSIEAAEEKAPKSDQGG